MARAERPSSPDEDLARTTCWRGPDGRLAAELAAFCQRGLSIVVATCDGARRPVAGLALACRHAEGAALRLLVRRSGNARILRAAENGAPLAATFSEPATHRSIQLKAARAAVAAAQPEDAADLARQTAFRDELVGVGYPASIAAAFCAYDPDDVVALVFEPEAAFVQTPGPGAGSALA